MVRGRVDFWRALAEDQGRDLRVRLPDGPLLVPLAVEDLADLVDVLIDNVFAHTPEGTALRVDLPRSTTATADVVLRVDGRRPGLRRPAAAARTGQHRPRARHRPPDGAGCGGRVRTGAAPEGGALVEVALPRASPDPGRPAQFLGRPRRWRLVAPCSASCSPGSSAWSSPTVGGLLGRGRAAAPAAPLGRDRGPPAGCGRPAPPGPGQDDRADHVGHADPVLEHGRGRHGAHRKWAPGDRLRVAGVSRHRDGTPRRRRPTAYAQP